MLETDVASTSRKIFDFLPWRLPLPVQVTSGKEKSYIDAENTETSGIQPLRKGLGFLIIRTGRNNILKNPRGCKFAPPPPTLFTG